PESGGERGVEQFEAGHFGDLVETSDGGDDALSSGVEVADGGPAIPPGGDVGRLGEGDVENRPDEVDAGGKGREMGGDAVASEARGDLDEARAIGTPFDFGVKTAVIQVEGANTGYCADLDAAQRFFAETRALRVAGFDRPRAGIEQLVGDLHDVDAAREAAAFDAHLRSFDPALDEQRAAGFKLGGDGKAVSHLTIRADAEDAAASGGSRRFERHRVAQRACGAESGIDTRHFAEG